jgi:hypothetical protein
MLCAILALLAVAWMKAQTPARPLAHRFEKLAEGVYAALPNGSVNVVSNLGKNNGPKTFTLSNAVFDRYVGRYRAAGGAIITVTRDDSRFIVQMAGQPPFEIFASSEREFFLNSFDARVTFEVDAGGRATAIVMNTGTDQRGTRIP